MIILGPAQGFSILPGVSRSGTTLTVLLLRNLIQDETLVISFDEHAGRDWLTGSKPFHCGNASRTR
ncbi:MAG: undecaprenyl-diphosphate phosphatase [Methanothrix sp.]|nr:undecaprenyl-diphosphate phosphatase [Methanothrix sp.]